ncbi:MAG TPA: acyl-CoA dehydrogenase family protein [Candidatus Dormibacteraeota bacterium]|nr:acyl-CoA dehydrogenase family protein [Candidatus Dormibacteraeota bacterium]
MTPDPVALATTISDDVLFPGALEVDASDIVTVDRLDRLASAGFYGLAGPADAGGMGLPDMAMALEIIASGCLTTAFVWIQHHGAVRALAVASQPLRDAWIRRLCAGDLRAGVAFSGLRRPGPSILTASPDGDGWRFQGFAPWVTGWGRIDVVRAAARRENGDIVWALVDAKPGPTLHAERLRLAAVNASATVTLWFDQHAVPADRVISIQPFEEWQQQDRASLRLNGSLALGVARRCAVLLESDALSAELDQCRRSLDQALPEAMPEQRAWAAELALRAATTLVVQGGGRAISLDHQAQRLAREALFLLVFGQTAAIKAAQLHRLYDESHG